MGGVVTAVNHRHSAGFPVIVLPILPMVSGINSFGHAHICYRLWSILHLIRSSIFKVFLKSFRCPVSVCNRSRGIRYEVSVFIVLKLAIHRVFISIQSHVWVLRILEAREGACIPVHPGISVEKQTRLFVLCVFLRLLNFRIRAHPAPSVRGGSNLWVVLQFSPFIISQWYLNGVIF